MIVKALPCVNHSPDKKGGDIEGGNECRRRLQVPQGGGEREPDPVMLMSNPSITCVFLANDSLSYCPSQAEAGSFVIGQSVQMPERSSATSSFLKFLSDCPSMKSRVYLHACAVVFNMLIMLHLHNEQFGIAAMQKMQDSKRHDPVAAGRSGWWRVRETVVPVIYGMTGNGMTLRLMLAHCYTYPAGVRGASNGSFRRGGGAWLSLALYDLSLIGVSRRFSGWKVAPRYHLD